MKLVSFGLKPIFIAKHILEDLGFRGKWQQAANVGLNLWVVRDRNFGAAFGLQKVGALLIMAETNKTQLD
jgi:hypothetical protein